MIIAERPGQVRRRNCLGWAWERSSLSLWRQLFFLSYLSAQQASNLGERDTFVACYIIPEISRECFHSRQILSDPHLQHSSTLRGARYTASASRSRGSGGTFGAPGIKGHWSRSTSMEHFCLCARPIGRSGTFRGALCEGARRRKPRRGASFARKLAWKYRLTRWLPRARRRATGTGERIESISLS
jgi:hypothetical protein